MDNRTAFHKTLKNYRAAIRRMQTKQWPEVINDWDRYGRFDYCLLCIACKPEGNSLVPDCRRCPLHILSSDPVPCATPAHTALYNAILNPDVTQDKLLTAFIRRYVELVQVAAGLGVV